MTDEKEKAVSEIPEERNMGYKTYIIKLDVGICLVSLIICGFIYQYFDQNVLIQRSTLCIFALVTMYYAYRVFRHKPYPVVVSEKVTTVLMLNDSGNVIKEWAIADKVALVIGKNTKQKDVDIDLSESMYDALIFDEHAVMNFAAGHWYLEALHTPSSISLQKASDKMRYRLTGVRPCKVEKGDIIFIASTRLMIK